MNTVRVLLSLAAHSNWDLRQFHVKNAFLNGELEEEVYMEIPPGFNSTNGENKVCRLKKALYGLTQSPRAWFGRFTKVMLSLGYRQSQGDHTLFFKHSQEGDDIDEKHALQERLTAEFEVKDLEKLRYFLGTEVVHSKQGIFICQRKYVLDLLKETGKLGCKPSSTPIEQNHKLGSENESPSIDKGQYQRIVGRLIYLAHTRPDLAYAVSIVSQFMHDPREKHLQAVDRILQYLKGTPGRGLLFQRGGNLSLEMYTDADYAGSVTDRRSTSGYYDLNVRCEGPLKLLCDNKSAICIAHNPVQHDHTKHIEIDRHFIKEKLDSGLITTYIPSSCQLADVLTKGLRSDSCSITHVTNTHSLESTENSEFVDALLAWTRELPLLLIQLSDNHPVCSKAVLHLLLCIGQSAPVHQSLVCTYDNLQSSLLDFYSTCQGGHICCGPFLRLPRESQELSLCCVSYFSHLDLPLLKSMACCCLSPDLDPHALFWTIDVLDSAYKAGHIKVTDFLNVFVTLVLHFEVSPDFCSVSLKSDPRRQTLRSMITRLSSCMVQMGNNPLVLQMIEGIIVQQIALKPFLDKSCSLLRMIFELDSDSDFKSKPKPSRLSEPSITFLGHHLLEYLMDAMQCIPEDGDKERTSSSILLYYLEPCFLLFGRCHKLMSLVLKTMRSAITETRFTPISDNYTQHTSNCLIKVDVVASVLIAMHKDKKLRKIMVKFKEDIDYIIQEIHLLQSSRDSGMTVEEKHKLHCTCEQLKILK
ncbi:uncharacterized protein LOC133304287 [Gastrolobium bilobum]|uniref:uncharacterized protein LOC133304287 n=1 Tax=Gastrolobium bilobum TaxID=150636 RepID=UPI002AAFF923|nr:uncharacterized protein LOC133304287 [Gastrolobium bilobum]